jgi:cytochrome c oxidase subunit 2
MQLYQLPASTYAHEIDFVVVLITVIVGFWYVVTNLMFFYLLWVGRAREGGRALYVTGHEPDLHRWIAWPHYAIIACDVVLIVAAVRVWYMVKQDLPAAEDTVRVVGQQWAWSFQHAGKDGQLDTADDIKTVDEMHVQVGDVVHARLESRDVLHSFSVPVFRLKQDVIPGRAITAWFEATVPGEYDIQCAEMCGIGHGIMAARIHVETPEEHAAWIAQASPKS